MNLDERVADAAKRYRTTPEMVADVLRDAILQGTLEGGRALKQDDIASKFRLSRGPVREAFRQLEGEGLIVIYPHRGAVVATLSLPELEEVCEMRVALEGLALRRAFPRLSDKILSEAEGILVSIDGREMDPHDWGDANWRFHSTLYAAAERPHLMATIRSLHLQMERYLRLQLSLMHYQTQAQREHWDILHACRHRDLPGALELLEHQIVEVGEMLSSYVPRGEEGAT
jgi:DNA-binding GntR family transcriptional regulator